MAKSKNDISHYSLGLKSLVYHKNPQNLAEPQQEKKQWEESYLQFSISSPLPCMSILFFSLADDLLKVYRCSFTFVCYCYSKYEMRLFYPANVDYVSVICRLDIVFTACNEACYMKICLQMFCHFSNSITGFSLHQAQGYY